MSGIPGGTSDSIWELYEAVKADRDRWKAWCESMLTEVREIIEKCSYVVDKDAVHEREVCNKFTLVEALKSEFGSEHFKKGAGNGPTRTS